MIKKANIQWSAKQLSKMVERGTINFDNAVQRGYVWDNNRKSLLIHSMIEGYPIPAFYAAKNDNGYDMLDGKQRSNAIAGYLNNEYALTGIPEVTLESGKTMDINGMMFGILPEELQDRIKDYSLTIYYFDGITDEEITEMFFRLNNGKPLTAIELTRVKAKSLDKIKELGKHELFNSALTEKALNKYTNEDIVIKSWTLLNVENPSFETKFIRPLIESAEITERQAEQITAVYDRILTTYKDIVEAGDKEALKVAKRIITRTHLLSLVPVALQSINDNISIEEFAEFVMSFFNGKKSASISDIYNSAAGSASGKAENVKKRITAITEAYKACFDKQKVTNTNKIINDFDNYTSDDWEESAKIPHEVITAYNCTI